MPGPAGWLRLPRRTARLRLTIVYSAAFLACSVAVVAFIYLFYGHLVHFSNQLPGSHVTGLPGGASLEQKTAAARAAAIDAQVNAALAQAAGKPGVRESLLQLKSVADKQVLAQVHFAMTQLLISCAIALAIIAVAAAAIGWLIAGRVLRPLSTITAAARRISASSLNERLALRGPDDELKELADTLDSLFERLEAAFGAQRRFAANASHELRTPLTRERTLLQVTLADPASTAETWQAVSRELLACNAEQAYLIDALLTLASSEAGTGERELLDLAAVASEALAAVSPEVSGLGLHVQADIQPASLDGDPLLVQQLATNLVDNAVRHNVPGGHVQVAVRTSGGRAVLSVANSGPVVAAADVGRLFQPFQRLGPRPARRGGHGLGLSIARAIAAAHGASIEARVRPEGGLVVEVAFRPPG